MTQRWATLTEGARWEQLFADLEGQLRAQDAAELSAEVVQRTRAATGELRLVDRLRSAIGHRLAIGLEVAPAGETLTGELRGVGPDWVLLAEVPGGETLVAANALAWVRGLGAGSSAPSAEGLVASRLALRHLIRGLVKDRCGVDLMLRDSARVQGTPDRVGADYLEIAEHPLDEARRPSSVRGVRTVALTAIVVLRKA